MLIPTAPSVTAFLPEAHDFVQVFLAALIAGILVMQWSRWQARRLRQPAAGNAGPHSGVESDSAWLRGFFARSPDLLLVTDAEGKIVEVNEAFERHSGYRREELLGRTPAILNARHHPPEFFAELWATIKSGRPFGGHFVNKAKDGSLFIEHEVITPIRDESGRITHFVAVGRIARDLSGAPAQELVQLETIRMRLRDALVVCNEAGSIQYANPAFRELYGIPPGGSVGQVLEECVAPEWAERIRAAHERHLRGERDASVGEYEAVRADGHRFPVEISISPCLTGEGQLGTQLLIRDLSARVEAERVRTRLEALLRESVQEWRTTFDSVGHAILVVGPFGDIRRVNKAAATLLGTSPREATARMLDAFEGGPWPRVLALTTLVRGEGPGERDEAFEAGGRRYLAHATRFAMSGVDGFVIVVLEDATRRWELQQRARAQEIMSQMGRLVAGVAHEVRNPLHSLNGLLDVFELRYASDERLAEYIRHMRRECDRLKRLMNDLLTYGQTRELQRKWTVLSPLLRQVAESVSAQHSAAAVRIEVTADPGEPGVLCDPDRMTQVFVNLLENALQHTPSGGAVTIRVTHNAGRVEAAIADTGPGVPEEGIAKVFEPFYTRRKGGTGLGLSIVKRIVEEHRGTVSIGHQAGAGAVFTVTLPVVPVEVAS